MRCSCILSASCEPTAKRHRCRAHPIKRPMKLTHGDGRERQALTRPQQHEARAWPGEVEQVAPKELRLRWCAQTQPPSRLWWLWAHADCTGGQRSSVSMHATSSKSRGVWPCSGIITPSTTSPNVSGQVGEISNALGRRARASRGGAPHMSASVEWFWEVPGRRTRSASALGNRSGRCTEVASSWSCPTS